MCSFRLLVVSFLVAAVTLTVCFPLWLHFLPADRGRETEAAKAEDEKQRGCQEKSYQEEEPAQQTAKGMWTPEG